MSKKKNHHKIRSQRPSSDEVKPDEYKIGYKSPPRHTQWKPKESGNPTGRPKKQPSIKELVYKAASENIKVTIDGQQAEISIMEASIKKICELAVKGNIKAWLIISEYFDQAVQDIKEDPNAAQQMEMAYVRSMIKLMFSDLDLEDQTEEIDYHAVESALDKLEANPKLYPQLRRDRKK